MRRFLMLLGAAAVGGVLIPLVPAAAQFEALHHRDFGSVRARIWVEGEQDEFRRGDRVRLRFAVSEDAHVAVVHIDTEGNLDFLFPATPWDDDYVRSGRTYSLPQRGFGASWVLREPAGIGYFYVIASPEPLDYSHFRGRGGGLWDWSYAGRRVTGDPFWALEELTRLLVAGRGYAPYAADYYTYYVGGRHRYPAYACADRLDRGGWGWSPYFGACDRLDGFLREYPYYYDTQRYRGNRWEYLRGLERSAPRHGFKEPVGVDRRGERWQVVRPPVREGPRARPVPPAQRRNPRGEPRVVPPRRRPVLERRPAQRDDGESPRVRRPPPRREDTRGGNGEPPRRPRPVQNPSVRGGSSG
jgi:hypothetical protein